MFFPIFLKILLSSIVATAAMTGVSYIISESFKKLFKEPVLLSYFLHRLKIRASAKTLTILAWLLHFLIGFLFVTIYHFIWSFDLFSFKWYNGLLLGAFSGIVGIIHWFGIFLYTNHQPKIPFTAYYIQLFLAHVIFGIVAFWTYGLF